MKRIKMLTLDAGPAGVRHPNTEHDVEDDEADALIESGHAVEPGEVAKPRVTASDPIEQATTGAEETAEGVAGKKGRGKK